MATPCWPLDRRSTAPPRRISGRAPRPFQEFLLTRASQELERFPPSYTEQDEVFEENMLKIITI